MSMADYTKAKAIIASNPETSTFAGTRSEALVTKAECALGLRFPATYRQFLLDFGAGNFGSREFYGVIDEDFENSSVPDGIWCTLSERREAHLPARFVIVADTGTGEWYCLDISQVNGPVLIVDPANPNGPVEMVAADFGAFLLSQVEQEASR